MTFSNKTQMAPALRLSGVRVHNLKAVDLDIPLGKLTVVSGVSGSGKTSLICETVFAESRRRFTETTSPQIRQILGNESKTDADAIENMPPAVVLRENSHTESDSASVAGMTGLTDYLAMLLSRMGEIVCPDCEEPVEAHNAESVARLIHSWPDGLRFQVGFLMPEETDEDFSARFQRFIELDSESPAGSGRLVIFDRLKTGKVTAERLVESLEQAFNHSEGTLILIREPAPSDPEQRIVPLAGQEWCWYQYSDKLTCCGCRHEFVPPHPQLFNSNSTLGACPECSGRGKKSQFEFDRIIPDETLSLSEGGVSLFSRPKYKKRQEQILNCAKELGLPVDQPISFWEPEQCHRLWLGKPASGVKGLLALLEEQFPDKSKYRTNSFRTRWMSEETCESCRGTKLRYETRAVRINGESFLQLLSFQADQLSEELQAYLNQLSEQEQTQCYHLIQEIKTRLQKLVELGFGDLLLNRSWNTLSAGERKRVQLAGILSAGLVNTLIVLDEPARSLHPLDQKKVLTALEELKRDGNTILIAENSHLFQQQADFNIVLGPGAGTEGGEVVYSGSNPAIEESLISDRTVKPEFPNRFIELKRISTRNLKEIDVRFPLHQLTVVSGVSGSGKTSLVYETLFPVLENHLNEIKLENTVPVYKTFSIDEPCSQVVWMNSFQKSASSRSILATFLKIFPIIREEFSKTVLARSRNLQMSDFSFNTSGGGRCEECSGKGSLEIDMHFMENLQMPCPACQGKRFRSDILEVSFRGLSIAEVLELSVKEAFEFFRKMPAIQKRLQLLVELGLDYLELGRSLNTLSHGERQRLKLAEFLSLKADGQTIYLLDEPSAGLHRSEIFRLRGCLQRLLEIGHTVVVIDNHPDLIHSADYLIELGPGAGEQGGELLAQGPAGEVLSSPVSLLGKLI